MTKGQRSLVALAVLAAARPARADDPPPPVLSAPIRPHVAAALIYRPAPGCKGEAALRGVVAETVGYDPFTPGAPRRIEVTITRESGQFVARWYDHDGGSSWPHKPIVLGDCGEVVRQLAVAIAWRLVPLQRPEPVVAPEPTVPPAPAPPVAAPPPPQAAPPAEPAQPAPPPPPKPGVFEGAAGIGRAVAFAVAGGSFVAGVGLAAAAASKTSEFHQVQGNLASTGGSGACNAGGAPLPSGCGQLVSLAQSHDLYTRAAIGTMAAAGITGIAAVASIWLVRTPGAHVELTPEAPGAQAGLTLRGDW